MRARREIKLPAKYTAEDGVYQQTVGYPLICFVIACGHAQLLTAQSTRCTDHCQGGIGQVSLLSPSYDVCMWHAVYWDPSIAIISNKPRQGQAPARRPPRYVYRLLTKEDLTKDLENEEVHASPACYALASNEGAA